MKDLRLWLASAAASLLVLHSLLPDVDFAISL